MKTYMFGCYNRETMQDLPNLYRECEGEGIREATMNLATLLLSEGKTVTLGPSRRTVFTKDLGYACISLSGGNT